MTAKELVIDMIVNRVWTLENEIKRLREELTDKEDELERLTDFLEKHDEVDE
jgi:hypothetical protein